MAKTEVTEFSTTNASNTDIAGYPTDGSQPPKNIKYWTPAVMGAIARMLSGAVAIKDTLTLKSASDSTKTFKFTGSNLTASTSTALDVSVLYRYGAFYETRYTGSGTHTFRLASKYFMIEAVGGGGGGGGADGQGSGRLAAASGGGSGFAGFTALLTKGSLTTATVTVGAAGTAGAAAGGNGGNGGDTEWSDGTNAFTWGGGKGGIGAVADTNSAGVAAAPGRATWSGSIQGSGDFRTAGFVTSPPSGSSAPGVAYGGAGGQSPYGSGGAGGSSSVGSAADLYGGGGGGAAVSETSTNYAGGAGYAGILIVREW